MTLGSRSCKSVNRYDPWTVVSGPSCSHLVVQSVISDSSRSHGLQQTRLLRPTWKQICSRHCCSAVPDPLHFTPLLFFSFLFPFLGTALGLFLQEPGAASHLSPHPMYGILVPGPGIEPMSLALEGRFLTTGSPGILPPTPAVCEALWSFLCQTSTQRYTHMLMATHTHIQKNTHIKAAPLH